MRVIAAHHPLRSDVAALSVADGSTLEQILAEAQPDPVLRAHAHIFVGDVRVPRERWSRVRPKASSVVAIRVVPQGGGGGGKNPLRTVLTIAVVAAAAYVAGPQGAAFFGSQFGAAAAGAAVAIGGNLLVNAIAPIRPPSLGDLSGTSQRDSPTLSIEGARNRANPFGVIPVVLGRHRHVPPLGAQTYTETIGDEQYLRMLVVWGYGPLKVEDLRISDTPLTDFADVAVQTREGRPGDAPITIYPKQVDEQSLGITLKQSNSWATRTSARDTDELSLDIVFPSGLVKFNDEGERESRSVSVQIEYRPAGSGTWLTPSYSATTVSSGWISGDIVRFNHRRTSAIRHGFRWSVPRGQYEVRIRRTTADTTDAQISDTAQWAALRSFTNENPVQFRHPLAMTALSIKATDQLNGVVDQLNGIVTSYVTDFDGSEVASSNPALLYRHVLQGNANARRMTDERVDLFALQAWRDYCDARGFEFNMVRDFEASAWDTLADIASTGRASPSQLDGKWSVTVDKPQPYPVQMFTPRNSWGFEAEKTFPDPPHAFRIRFADRNQDWEQGERIVYADGYDESNAEVFETLDAPGITDSDHAWKFGRFQLAQALLRPERWTKNLDFEHLVCRRGDRVAISHDVLLVGLGQGRIKEVISDELGDAIGIVVDEPLEMTAGTTYGVSMRTVDDVALARELVTVEGAQAELTFASPVPAAAAPMAGDLVAFGESGNESIDGLVLSIEPQGDLVARLVLIPYSPAVYDADTGVIPDYDPGITPIQPLPDPEIVSVRSDESVLQLGAGSTLIPHIAIGLADSGFRGAVAEAQLRPSGTGEPWVEASVVGRTGSAITLGDVAEGASYDLRVRWNDGQRAVPGRWGYVYGHRVIGKSSPPQGLGGLTISAFGGSALLRWDRPPELDVRFGGEVRFRHSPEINASAATWASSTGIGDAAKGDARLAQLPLKRGTYLARVFDRDGRPSETIAAVSSKQASVLAFAAVDSVTESPTFPGVKNGTVANDDSLSLTAMGLFDDIPDFDELSDLDSYGGINPSGIYEFAGGIDLGSVRRVRLTSVIDATAVNVLDRIDERTDPIDSWEDFDGTSSASADARVQVRHTDDDPAGGPAWSAWNDLDSAEFEARAFEFRVRLMTQDSAYNIRIDELSITAEEVA